MGSIGKLCIYIRKLYAKKKISMPTFLVLPKGFMALNFIKCLMKYKVENTSKFKQGKAYFVGYRVYKLHIQSGLQVVSTHCCLPTLLFANRILGPAFGF